MKRVEICYPNFSKKAITFTMDDGNLVYDKKLIDIVAPHGIRGTFNLCRIEYEGVSAEELRELYRGHEIANHCKWHPFVFRDDESYTFTDDEFDKATADDSLIYKNPDRPGMYRIRKTRGWRPITTPEKYIELIKECKRELESVFGEGSIKGFVWPFCPQNSKKVIDYLASSEYRSVRTTERVNETTGFNIPDDPMAWGYNARQSNLLEVAELFDAYPDDGRLKFFAFGVHSIDYEKSEKWGDVEIFARKYGDRPEDFWYATVGEIFDYISTAQRMIVTDVSVINPSEHPLYVLIDGEGCEIPAGASMDISDMHEFPYHK